MSNGHEIGDYQTANTLETFGFLPKFTQDEVYDQIEYLIAQGWTAAIEHEHPSQSSNHYWTMWKLPFFGEKDLNAVAAEIEAGRRAYPDPPVRLIGYANSTPSQGVCFVVHAGR
jgi:ribulose-bisphosphate carboxylase small chain